MTIQQAIKKAKESGWDDGSHASTRDEMPIGTPYCYEVDGFFYNLDFLLDPLFWQSLGKAMGWGTYEKGWKDDRQGTMIIGEVSLKRWHEFIEHLWTGKDAESFFESL